MNIFLDTLKWTRMLLLVGIDSTHLVKWSLAVNMYVCPKMTLLELTGKKWSWRYRCGHRSQGQYLGRNTHSTKVDGKQGKISTPPQHLISSACIISHKIWWILRIE